MKMEASDKTVQTNSQAIYKQKPYLQTVIHSYPLYHV
jgi:hypothetical protein